MRFQNLTDAGIPLGPLAAERDLWVLPSGRGHQHLDATCRDGLVLRRGTLSNMTDRERCTSCSYRLSALERDYLTWASSFENALGIAAFCMAPTREIRQDDASTLGTSLWMATSGYLMPTGPFWADFSAWAETVAVPQLREALAVVEEATGATPPGPLEAMRGTAAAAAVDSVAEHELDVDRFPALVADKRRLSKKVDGENYTLRFLLERGAELYPAGTHETVTEGAIAEAAGRLPQGPTNPVQIPRNAPVPDGYATLGEAMDAAWRDAAHVEFSAAARLFLSAADRHLARVREEFEHVFVASFDPRFDPSHGDGLVSAHAVDALADGRVVLHVRTSVLAWCKTRRPKYFSEFIDLGRVPEDYSRELVASTLEMLNVLDSIETTKAMDLARAALLS